MYYVLRGTGAVVWRPLAYSTTPDEIVERLVETYGIDQTRAADDVDHFLATLKGRGLLAS